MTYLFIYYDFFVLFIISYTDVYLNINTTADHVMISLYSGLCIAFQTFSLFLTSFYSFPALFKSFCAVIS